MRLKQTEERVRVRPNTCSHCGAHTLLVRRGAGPRWEVYDATEFELDVRVGKPLTMVLTAWRHTCQQGTS